MNFEGNILYALLFIALITSQTNGQGNNNNNKVIGLTPFSSLGKNIGDSYSGTNLLFQLGAVGLMYVIVESNLDAWMLEQTSKLDHNTSEIIGMPGIIVGYLAPIVVPAGMYLFSEKNSDLRNASFAVLQSIGIAFVANSILKSITGRTSPNPDFLDKEALSRDFNFSFFGGGMHYGWPSGHLMTNMAMVSALTSYYNDKSWLKWAGYGYIAALAVTVLIDERGSAHWLSEIVAGTLMGYAIGSTVGKNFKETSRLLSDETSLQLSPNVGRDYYGISLGVRF